MTFSNDSSIQHVIAPLTNDAARARIADSVPDKYKVQRSPDERCVVCGVKMVMNSVIKNTEAGTHLILVTRGDDETLSLSDETTIQEYARYYQVRFRDFFPGIVK